LGAFKCSSRKTTHDRRQEDKELHSKEITPGFQKTGSAVHRLSICDAAGKKAQRQNETSRTAGEANKHRGTMGISASQNLASPIQTNGAVAERHHSESFLTGANIDFIEALYARYLAEPQSVDAGWRAYFSSQAPGGKPLVIDGLILPPPRKNAFASQQTDSQAKDMGLQGKVDQTIISFRLRGHLLAQLDPLGTPRPTLEHVADIGLVSRAHFNESELATPVSSMESFDEPRVPLKRVLDRLRKTYCHKIGVEFAHLADSERRRWLMRKMESCENSPALTSAERKNIMRGMANAEVFEATAHTKFQAVKRFSIEGGEAMLPMIENYLELGGSLGVREVVIGMAHRGRLNVLCNIMQKPAHVIFSEFAGPSNPQEFLNRSDVKYHMGYSSDWTTQAGQSIHLTMAFNPSHLGVVHPVVEGRVRAKQDRFAETHGREAAKHAIVPFVIHGDAAFSGQGLIAETLNLADVPAYSTGGTVHLIVNNQIGFTTEASQGRSSLYCTGQAQMLDIPIFHVNGDDPEACVHVMKLACEYRQRFHSDVVIDLVCYRKYGHNEGDEPSFTQPTMYQAIRARKTPREVYALAAAAAGTLTESDCKSIFDEAVTKFSDEHAKSKTGSSVKDPSHLQGIWKDYRGGPDRETPQVDTGVELKRAQQLLKHLSTNPEGFVLHPNVARPILEARTKMVAGEEKIDWGTGEMLAYASLVTQGFSVRLTGQDCERGTFAHRQAVLHDSKTGQQAFPLGNIDSQQAPALIVNSPLSEMACVGFEFGYSLDCPDGLVVWEAQFGDFANNAQVIIDQFIAAAEDKWKRMSALTLLLPHGYEGAGPEHSSARLERFLELAAEDNIQVAHPTSASQIFHLLRRQALRKIRKPLVIMTPKSLFRMAECRSPWSDFTTGTFKRVIPEINSAVEASKVTRLILCSGKVYFDLLATRDAAKDFSIAIVRVEQLYPLPEDELNAMLKSMPALQDIVWAQEEPKNSGAWRFMLEHLMVLSNRHTARPPFRYVGRPESASPATGWKTTHDYEQKLLVTEAIQRGS
jgi:2-oxoglutarate dehydrogenase E1 component